MKNMLTVVLPLLLALLNGNALCGEDKKLEDLPPVVVRSSPVSGDDMVDPSLQKIMVSFSQEMVDKSWSFVMEDKESFPILIGNPLYEKGMKTCVLNVKLKPDTTYIIWINSGQFMNFKGKNGKASLPYLLAFKTAGKDYLDKKSAALKCAKQWMALLSDKKYAESWTSAADFFQSKVKQDIWKRQISAIYSKLGTVSSRKLVSARYLESMPGAPEGKYFILHFATSFSEQPKAFETIVPMLGADGKWKVSGYYIK